MAMLQFLFRVGYWLYFISRQSDAQESLHVVADAIKGLDTDTVQSDVDTVKAFLRTRASHDVDLFNSRRLSCIWPLQE